MPVAQAQLGNPLIPHLRLPQAVRKPAPVSDNDGFEGEFHTILVVFAPDSDPTQNIRTIYIN